MAGPLVTTGAIFELSRLTIIQNIKILVQHFFFSVAMATIILEFVLRKRTFPGMSIQRFINFCLEVSEDILFKAKVKACTKYGQIMHFNNITQVFGPCPVKLKTTTNA